MFEEMMIEEMKKEIVKKKGFEDFWTVHFCEVCEWWKSGIVDYGFVRSKYLMIVNQ